MNPIGPARIVFVDPDGRLGTVPIAAGGNPGKSPGVRPEAIPDAAHQTMLDLKVQKLRATVSQQQQQIEILMAQFKENAAQIQKANTRFEINKPVAKVVANKR
jgi:N-methylhydantoinase A/oxoprolinase/acetone carboxylase beta subunit